MINIARHVLANGLVVLVHTDKSSPLATVNLRYYVGARNESPNRTGFAHLFEHLMFGGSRNIPDFDVPVQLVGGENNAYTTNDYTNYYITLPANNLETAFWVESDRMLELDFSEESLDVQRNVVMEEFKQRCLNVPYGDLGHLQRALVYEKHPYRWPTIGLELNHIAEASLGEVKQFYYDYYAPDNAVLAVCGDVKPEEVFSLAEKWFGGINRKARKPPIEAEPVQTTRRTLCVQRNVPADYISLMYHMGGRTTREYYICDLLTDVLADGVSSRLVQRMVKNDRTMAEVDASIWGSMDPGILTFNGTMLPGVKFADVEQTFREEIDRLKNNDISDYELQKVKNRTEATKTFRELSLQAKAVGLCSCEMAGDANLINTESDIYASISRDELCAAMQRICVSENESVLYYQSSQKQINDPR